MNNHHYYEYGNISYTFHITSAEDFYRQLREYADTREPETEITNTDLARDMLRDIGVNCD